jgi:hypothetical protein
VRPLPEGPWETTRAAVRTGAADADVIAGRGPSWLRAAAARIVAAIAEKSPEPSRAVIVRRPTAEFVACVLACRTAGLPFELAEPGTAQPASTAVLLDTEPEPGGGVLDLRGLLQGLDDSPAVPRVAGDDSDWAVERFGLGSADRIAVVSAAPAALAAAVATAVAGGSTLLLPDRTQLADVGHLGTWLRENEVTVAYLSPPVLRALAARAGTAPLPALRYAFIENNGELIARDIDGLRRLAASARGVALHRLGIDGRPLLVYPVPDDWQLETAPMRVPFGWALDRSQVRLQGPSGEPAAVGEVGEIWAGRQPTGELARRWADGTIEFAGRVRARRGDQAKQEVAG